MFVPQKVTNVGWGVTLGRADGLMPHPNSACREAVESASGVQILLPKEVAIVAYRHLSYSEHIASPLIGNPAEN